MTTTDFPAVERHGDLRPIFEDAWYVTGSVLLKPLVRLIRNMVVLRHKGELTLVNAVRLDAEGERALDALGDVAHVMKIGGHGMDDAYYAYRYGAKLWAADPQDGAAAERSSLLRSSSSLARSSSSYTGLTGSPPRGSFHTGSRRGPNDGASAWVACGRATFGSEHWPRSGSG